MEPPEEEKASDTSRFPSLVGGDSSAGSPGRQRGRSLHRKIRKRENAGRRPGRFVCRVVQGLEAAEKAANFLAHVELLPALQPVGDAPALQRLLVDFHPGQGGKEQGYIPECNGLLPPLSYRRPAIASRYLPRSSPRPGGDGPGLSSLTCCADASGRLDPGAEPGG